MTARDLAIEFERQRGHLFNVVYRMLGSVGDAEDVVQDVWLRWQAGERDDIEHPRAWLTRTATRLAIDQLRSARQRRTDYVGPWLPEPLLGDAPDDPSKAHETADAVSLALLLALERLGPEERAAFLLREVFDVDYGEIAATLKRTEAACRQMVKRARARVAADRPRFEVDASEHARVVRAFAAAVARGDPGLLVELFSPDVELWSDGGGRVAAFRKPLFGRERVIEVLTGLARVQRGPLAFELRQVNGRLGLELRDSAGLRTLVALKVRDGAIRGLYLIRNPDKLPA